MNFFLMKNVEKLNIGGEKKVILIGFFKMIQWLIKTVNVREIYLKEKNNWNVKKKKKLREMWKYSWTNAAVSLTASFCHFSEKQQLHWNEFEMDCILEIRYHCMKPLNCNKQSIEQYRSFKVDSNFQQKKIPSIARRLGFFVFHKEKEYKW